MNDLDSDYESYPPHMCIPDEDIQAVYAELTMNGEYDLLPYERDWKARGPLLARYGYRLRQRYNLDWQPSWENTNLNPFYCEDSIDSSTPNVMDAVRVADGLPVAIKATLSWTTEAPIAFLFTDGDVVAEPRNHCVPILDTFPDETEDIVYIVMPFLRAFNDPAFVAVAEVIDFVDQMIQGIEYMHEQNVAHRDITIGNIMMDASELFPEGFHPVRQNLSRNGLTEVVGIMRTHAPVRYYLIDFDAAIAFEKGTPVHHKFAEGKAGRDDEVPEFKSAMPYDPFKVDIFQFGNLLRKEILQRYAGVEFLEPLVREMTKQRPNDRPNAKALRLSFNTIRNRLTHQIRAHLEPKNTSDPLREHLAALGIESLLESESDDSPDQSSSEAATTGRSSHSNESYWSAAKSMDSSITSQSSTEHHVQQQQQQGALQKITGMFSRPRSPARTSSSGGTTIWKPTKSAKARSPSPPPMRSAPQAIPQPDQHSASTSASATGSPRSRSRGPYLRTGKFPWSRSSSPDSASQSPILAVVNHFLSPERMYTDEVFENTYQPPVEERMGRTRPIVSTPAAVAAPPKINAPAPATTRNRRNTVNAPPAPAPAPAPVSTPPVQAGKPATGPKSRVGGWDAMESVFDEYAPPRDYMSYTPQPTYNKATSTPPMFSSQTYTTWNSSTYNQEAEDQYGMPEEEMHEDHLWSEDALRALSSPPPSKSLSTKPVEKKEPVVEKKAKQGKSAFSTLSKKSNPTEAVLSTPVLSTTSTSRTGVTASKLASAAVNRKSTIAVEDATPFNTPPRTTASLPPVSVSPPKTSPVKVKKTKSKKGSISETPKEKEKEKEKESPVTGEEPWSMPAIKDDFGTVKTRKRGGSSASTTSRPSSPLAFFGSRSRSGSKVEPPPKPASAKPASFISSAFGWGAKSKSSPTADLDMDTGAFSFATPSFGWNRQSSEEAPKANPQRAVPSPQPEAFASDFNMSASPMSTPPPKAGWKAKTSYFSAEPTSKPAARSPQEEEDLDNLKASMRMSMSPNVEAAPSIFKFSDEAEESPSQFTMPGGEAFWASAMNAFGLNQSSFREEERPRSPEPVVEAPRSLPPIPKAKASKKAESTPAPAPEPVDTKPAFTKGKKKVTKAKTTISVESPTPTPTTEAEDPWNMVEAPRTKASKPIETSMGGNTDWFGSMAEEEERTPGMVAAADLEPASPEPDSWFNINPKAKSGTKPASKGKKVTKVEEIPEAEPEPVIEQPKLVVEEVKADDDEWPEVKPKGKKSKVAKEAEPVKVSPAPAANKWASIGAMDNTDADDLAASLAAELEEQDQSPTDAVAAAKEAEKEAEKETAKSSGKTAQPKNAKGKKKGKR